MKIVIPVDSNKSETGVCLAFARAPYFLVYDTESEEKSFLENSGASSAGGAGIKAAQLVVDSKADALLAPRCGENAAEVLAAGGVKMYKTEGNCLQSNIDAFNSGRLKELEDIHPGHHGHGGN